MINDIIYSVIEFFERLGSSIGLDNALNTLNSGLTTIQSYLTPFFNFISNVTYFVPKQHLIIIFGISFALVVIRLALAIYKQVAQVIP